MKISEMLPVFAYRTKKRLMLCLVVFKSYCFSIICWIFTVDNPTFFRFKITDFILLVSLRPPFSEAIAIWLVRTVNVTGRGLNGLNVCRGVASARNDSRTERFERFGRNGERFARNAERSERNAERFARNAERFARNAERFARNAERFVRNGTERFGGVVARFRVCIFDVVF